MIRLYEESSIDICCHDEYYFKLDCCTYTTRKIDHHYATPRVIDNTSEHFTKHTIPYIIRGWCEISKSGYIINPGIQHMFNDGIRCIFGGLFPK